jgi:prepilin-type N-terminal cleavage/methylation domain-containing protein
MQTAPIIYRKQPHFQQGFSLLEMGIVMVIMGVLLLGMIQPFSQQKENERMAQAKAQMNEIKVAIMGFVQAHGRLPCPAFPTNTPNLIGKENYIENTDTFCRNTAGAAANHGFIPGNTLGIQGSYTSDGLLLDPWNNPYRYSMSNTNNITAPATATWDFIDIDEMKAVGMANLLIAPNLLRVCSANSTNPANCLPAATNTTVIDRVPLIFFSMGKDWENTTSLRQRENAGENTGALQTIASVANPALQYPIASNNIFALSPTNVSTPANTFDDLVYWISENEIYAALYQAGHLP